MIPMRYLKNKNLFCLIENCKSIPNFAFPGEKIGKYCKKHKLPEMLNITNKKCSNEKCNITGNYGFFGVKTSRYCKMHKLSGMININNKKCVEKTCENSANYGFSERVYCENHKLSGMTCLNVKYCNGNNNTCNIQGTFKFPGDNRKYCKLHKWPEMISTYKH
jgi:hypothetical protein